jgi:hypothetical protein
MESGMAEIAPALTAEEWKRLNESDAVVRELVLRDKNGKTWDLTTIQEMALLNSELPDDDPRKITREQIGLLRGLVRYAIGAYTAESPAEETKRASTKAEQFLAALAALLPPEG